MSATVPLETGTHNVRRAFVQYCLSVLGTFLENPPLSFEGVSLNSRHPSPRRVWKGGQSAGSGTISSGSAG